MFFWSIINASNCCPNPSHSVPIDSILPGAEHLSVIRLFNANAPLVLDLSKLGGTLFVHAILQVASHSAVTLANLAKHIRLMGLLFVSDPEGLLFMSTVLPVNLVVDHLLVVVLKPMSLALHRLLQQDVLLTVLVDVLEEVDTGLVLTAPLLLASVPLLLVFDLSQLIDHLLVLSLARFGVLVMSLELLDLPTASHALILLHLLDCLLMVKSLTKEYLIPVKVDLIGLLTK